MTDARTCRVGPARTGRRTLPRIASAIAAWLVVALVPLAAQEPPVGPGPVAIGSETPRVITPLDLLVGRSAVVSAASPVVRVSITDPGVADVLVTSSRELLVHGKAPGTVTMFVWSQADPLAEYHVVVRRDLAPLVQRFNDVFPGEPIEVAGSGADVVLAGVVPSQYVIDKAAEMAAGYAGGKAHVVNLLRLREGVPSTQVMLTVRFAEVSRTALTELGGSLFTSPSGFRDVAGRATTQQYAAPAFDDGKLVFSDFLNLMLFSTEYQVGAVIKALQSRGLFQSLAEPNLIAESGKEASFLAGGEYPYPAVQGAGVNLGVTILFKEYGIRLSFTPAVIPGSDLIRLKVRPEVSALDFTNAVVYQGFRIPSLTTRRAETEVELRDGQTFAIAGLVNNTLTRTLQKIPGIGDVPILGLLFRSKAAQKAQTELVVMITPRILRRDSTGAVPALPTLVEPFLAPVRKPAGRP